VKPLRDGLKSTVSCEPLNAKKTLKIVNSFATGALGFKADFSGVLGAAPKAGPRAGFRV
jgi:hypothetical protein